MLRVPTDAEKEAAWDAYRARRPTRVPLTWGANARIILLDPERGDSYLNRAIILEELGRKNEAVDDLREFILRAAEIDMDPGDARAIEATKRLLRLERELGLESTISDARPDEGGEE